MLAARPRNGPAALARRAALALASALILGAYGRYPQFVLAGWIGLVPWVVLYTDPREPRVRIGWFLLSGWVYWMLAYAEAFRYGVLAGTVLGALGLAACLWCFVPLLRVLHARLALPRTLAVPLAWVATEWLRARFMVAHFEYQALGYTQAPLPVLVQIADLLGVHGVSFLLAACNGLLADAWFARREEGSLRAAVARPGLRACAVAVAGALVLTLGYGVLRLGQPLDEEGPRVAVIQPAIAHTIRNAIGVHLTQVAQTERHVPQGAVDLIVWPENAILDDLRREGAYLDDLGWLARRKGAPILLGASAPSAQNPLRANNSAFLVDGAGEIVGRADKRILFPFSEYVPLGSLLEDAWLPVRHAYLTALRRAWGFVPNGVPGEAPALLRLETGRGPIPFAAVTCWDNAYPPVVSELRRLGARFAFHLTSEGEAGNVIHHHALRYCVLRAIENRLPYVRAGNTGISCVIDAAGRVRDVLRDDRGGVTGPGVLLTRARLTRHGVPPYAASGDLFARGTVALTLALSALGLLEGRRRTSATLARAAAAGLVLAAVMWASGCAGGKHEYATPAEALAWAGRASPTARSAAFAAALRRACEDPALRQAAVETGARWFRASGDAVLGAELFGELAGRYPELAAECLGLRGYFLQSLHDYRGSLAAFERAVAGPASSRVWMLYGNLLAKGKEHARARQAYREAVRLDPSDAHARYLLARTLRLTGSAADAEQEIERVVSERPEHGSAWVEVARLRLARGDLPGAEEALRRAIANDPRNLEARFLLARNALREGRAQEFDRLTTEIRAIEETLGRGPRED
jgi:apolipoprotein N-acyltransferase